MTEFFLHVGLKDLNTFPLLIRKSRRWSPSSERLNTTSFDYLSLVKMTHCCCLLLPFEPKHCQTDGCLLTLWLGCTVFFHSAVNVFVIAVPLVDDGYAGVQWGLSLHMFSTRVALCRLISSSNIRGIHIWNEWLQLKGVSCSVICFDELWNIFGFLAVTQEWNCPVALWRLLMQISFDWFTRRSTVG